MKPTTQFPTRRGIRHSVLLISGVVLSAYASAQTPIWNHNAAAQSGPTHWGAFAPQYATCGTLSNDKMVEVGMKQTPINIEFAKAVEAVLPTLAFRYNDTPLEVENTGHVVEVVYEPGSHLRIGRSLTDEYQLAQFHFHSPSEHTIDGKRYDAEVHLVHTNRLGDIAVVGVLLTKSATAAAGVFDDILTNALMTTGAADGHGELNAHALLPADRSYFTYTGSLTTPPCTESVRWFVMTQPVSITEYVNQQLHTIVGQFPGYNGYQNNNRPIAPLNGRTVLISH